MEQQPPPYLKRDLVTLVVVAAIITAAIVGLWQAEQQRGWFSRTAALLLDATTR